MRRADALQQRERERRRLPGAGGREPEHVAAGEERGDGLGLDRRRLLVAEGGERVAQLGAQPEGGEGGGAVGHAGLVGGVLGDGALVGGGGLVVGRHGGILERMRCVGRRRGAPRLGKRDGPGACRAGAVAGSARPAAWCGCRAVSVGI
jgi:hypothetical protein